MARFDFLVVGAGFAGAVCAERLASAGKSVLIVDQRRHVGGNAYDFYNEYGILVSLYGPHCFHTNSKDVFDYLSRFTAWRAYEHRVRANVGGQLVPVPINDTTIRILGGEAQARDAIIVPYTRKQWGCEPEDLDPSVLARVKTRAGTDDRYFTDTYQYMPLEGYTTLFERMLAHPNITVTLNTHAGASDYEQAPSVLWTGPIDEYFEYRFGRLPYRSAEFEFRTLEHESLVQPVAVINYPDAWVPFTRVTECKHLTGQVHQHTTLIREYPRATGDPYWPVPKPENAALYRQYKALADATPHVHFLGRLGSYQYFNLDQVVAQALKLTRELLSHQEAA